MSENWSGKVVVVTGAAQGIGRAIVEKFGGAEIWALDLDAPGLEHLRDRPGVSPYTLDVSDEAAVVACIGQIVDAHGSIDMLVHCAAGVRGQVSRPISAMIPICASTSVLRLRTARSRQIPEWLFAEPRLKATMASKEALSSASPAPG